MSYYVEIDGKKYDKKLIELADELTQSAGDGRISKADADKLLQGVMDGDSYTDVEKDTIKYIREKYNWTEAADEHFRTEIRRWAGKRGAHTD